MRQGQPAAGQLRDARRLKDHLRARDQNWEIVHHHLPAADARASESSPLAHPGPLIAHRHDRALTICGIEGTFFGASEHARNGPSVANDARVLPAHVHWRAVSASLLRSPPDPRPRRESRSRDVGSVGLLVALGAHCLDLGVTMPYRSVHALASANPRTRSRSLRVCRNQTRLQARPRSPRTPGSVCRLQVGIAASRCPGSMLCPRRR